MLEVRNVSKSFHAQGRVVRALESVNLEVNEGEFVSLVGPSGCGKTTLLRVIDGLTPKDEGDIVLDATVLDGISRDMAIVFQDINLLPWFTVRQNVEIGLVARGVPEQERRRLALESLEMVGLKSVADSPPYTLSGGMQQRVGVARALAVKPKVLLMDEPFGQLDNFTREALQVEFSKLWHQLKMTVVFVTHDVDEAIFLSDRIALFKTDPGRLTQVVDVGLPHPRWEYNVRAERQAIELREHIIDHLDVQRDVLL